jgi:hypothetical protein
MHPDFVPKTEAGILEWLKEECAEVIKEACKITRNAAEGKQQTPEYTVLHKTPVERLMAEMDDLRHAIDAAFKILGTEIYGECNPRLSPCGTYMIHKANCTWAIKYGAIREDNLPNMSNV